MRFPFTQEAQARLRAIDRPVALRILEKIADFGATGIGDIEPMHGEWQGCYRLRVGEYQVVFRYIGDLDGGTPIRCLQMMSNESTLLVSVRRVHVERTRLRAERERRPIRRAGLAGFGI